MTDPIAPPAAPAQAQKPIVVTKPMAAHPLGSPGVGAVVTHRATQMSASAGVPSTLESPKDAMLLLRAEAQTRIERPLGSARPSGVPSTADDVDSTLPDNAARDAAIRDAAREADERAAAGSQAGSKRFGPPTLQSPNDGALPSSNAPSIGGAVVDAILPSAAFVKPDPPPTTPTQGSGPPPIPPAWNIPAAGFGARARPVHAPAPAMAPPDALAARAGGVTAALAQTGGHGGKGSAYFPGAAVGSGAQGPFGQSAAAPVSAPLPAGVPKRKSGAAVVLMVVAALAVVAVVAIVAVGFYMRARGGQIPFGATNPSGAAAPADGKNGK